MNRVGKLPRRPRSDGKYLCTKCGEWFEVGKFQVANGTPRSWCRQCTSKLAADRRKEFSRFTKEARELLSKKEAAMTYQEIGDALGISKQWANQIAVRALVKLIYARHKLLDKPY